jgi:hypothetical protein
LYFVQASSSPAGIQLFFYGNVVSLKLKDRECLDEVLA